MLQPGTMDRRARDAVLRAQRAMTPQERGVAIEGGGWLFQYQDGRFPDVGQPGARQADRLLHQLAHGMDPFEVVQAMTPFEAAYVATTLGSVLADEEEAIGGEAGRRWLKGAELSFAACCSAGYRARHETSRDRREAESNDASSMTGWQVVAHRTWADAARVRYLDDLRARGMAVPD